VNRAELVDAVASATETSRKDAEDAVNAVLDTIVATVKAGEEVRIFGFGNFAPKANAARTGRNPQTGESIKIAASKSVRFTPAKAFKDALNTKAKKKKK